MGTRGPTRRQWEGPRSKEVGGAGGGAVRVQVASAVSCGPRSPLPGSAVYIHQQSHLLRGVWGLLSDSGRPTDGGGHILWLISSWFDSGGAID